MKQVLLLGVLLALPCAAVAQVTVNPAALQQLAGVVAPPPPPLPVPAPPAPVRHWHHFRAAAAPKPVPAQPKPPVIATAAHVPAPKPVPAAPKPPAAVALVFAPGSADLPGNASAALKPFCASPFLVTIDARAPADPGDPSAAMRLSLSRAMAVQQALTACGVPGSKILPRADGDVPGGNEDQTIIGGGPKK